MTNVLTMSCLIFRFFAINAAVIYVYFNSYQKLDEEEYGGITEVLKEGLMTSFASFLVSKKSCFKFRHAGYPGVTQIWRGFFQPE